MTRPRPQVLVEQNTNAMSMSSGGVSKTMRKGGALEVAASAGADDEKGRATAV